MTHSNAKKIYQKYINGDAFTDDELSEGITFFKDLADKLVFAGPVFALAFKEANTVYIALEGYQSARIRY